ncbi:MAG: hypothetical protein IPM84_14905 [Anaerolineae bacterium]|nr:hypothetical protein [Anaerolineae bacterium]
MTVGAQWGYTWFFEGKAADSATLTWDGPPDGLMRMVLTNDTGMAAGNWRLELTIGDQPAARRFDRRRQAGRRACLPAVRLLAQRG